jgi:hypothetical protein
MRILTGLILASALFVGPALAQPTGPPPGGGDMRAACQADVQSLCASVAGGDDRRAIGKCLRDNKDKLSQGCKDAMAARMAEREGKSRGKGKGAPACRADAEKLCAGIQPGEGRIMACLKEKQAQVSDACKSEMAQMKSRTP